MRDVCERCGCELPAEDGGYAVAMTEPGSRQYRWEVWCGGCVCGGGGGV